MWNKKNLINSYQAYVNEHISSNYTYGTLFMNVCEKIGIKPDYKYIVSQILRIINIFFYIVYYFS